MLKKLFIVSFLVTFLFAGIVHAHSGELHKPGITPNSPFYFLDKIGETLQSAFTFRSKSEARLQIAFAEERIAEIKVMLEEKGVETKGIDIAQSRLLANVAKANEIVAEQIDDGEDVSNFALELVDELLISKIDLFKTFKKQKNILKLEKDELKIQLKDARNGEDLTLEESLETKLSQVKIELDLLDTKKDDINDDLNEEEDHFDDAMNEEEEAQRKIAKAEREIEEVIREAEEEGVTLPLNSFDEFNESLLKAKSAFDVEEFVQSKQFAKQARKSLDVVGGVIDEMENAIDMSEDVKEAIKEAEEELEEFQSKMARKSLGIPPAILIEFNNLLIQAQNALDAQDFEKAERLAEQAEDVVGDTEDDLENEQEEIKEENDNKGRTRNRTRNHSGDAEDDDGEDKEKDEKERN